MVIDLATDEEFRRLLASLARELVDANIHWKLRRDLGDRINDFSTEYNQTPTFWSLTFQAHVDATVFRLIRIYDGNSDSLSLRNLLDTISANLGVFETERFRERLKDNPFVESLASDARKPDQAQLTADISFASNGNPLVKKLTIWRNNLFAHKSASNVVKNYDISADYPLDDEEIEKLLAEGMDILNRYSSLFEAATYLTTIVGDDDYQYLLNAVRADLRQHEEAVEREIRANDRRTRNES